MKREVGGGSILVSFLAAMDPYQEVLLHDQAAFQGGAEMS